MKDVAFVITRTLVTALILLLLGACTTSDARQVEIGTVRLIANGIEHEPYHHFIRGTFISESGHVSGTGIPFDSWLESNASTMLVIQYADDLHIVIDGRDAQIGGEGDGPVPWSSEEYYDGMRLIFIRTDLAGERFCVLLPGESGIYLLSVLVEWVSEDRRNGGDGEFRSHRYVFKIVR
ncbi:MAG: hypothetical protein FWE12_06660 [Oscillospiraceae bacterium]|nr:hypothetical protein [Oscillospiraceae bacterium]